MRSTQSLGSFPSAGFEMVVVNAVHWILITVQVKMVSKCSGKSICALPHLLKVSQVLPLRWPL